MLIWPQHYKLNRVGFESGLHRPALVPAEEHDVFLDGRFRFLWDSVADAERDELTVICSLSVRRQVGRDVIAGPHQGIPKLTHPVGVHGS